MDFFLPGPSDVVPFVLAKSFKKEDWLMCNACGLPQLMHEGCCFDPDCYPHVFRTDYCVYCGFGYVTADPAGYDFVAGKAKMASDPDLRKMQERALCQYNMEDVRIHRHRGLPMPRATYSDL